MIGTRGHDLGGMMSPQELAKRAKDKSLDSVQLVAYRSIEGTKEEAGYMTHGWAEKIGMAFRNEGVRVALIGCYINIPHADLNRFKEYLMYARQMGGSIVGTETGSVNPDYSFNPLSHGEEAFQRDVEKFKELTAYAQNFGVCVGVEAVYTHIIHSVEKMKRLLDAVDSPNLRVIFDPVNLVTVDNHAQLKEMIEKAFKLFGEKIVIIHGKDFVIEGDQIKMVPLGEGLMDYEHLYGVIKQYKYDIDVIIEDYQGEALDKSIAHLEQFDGRKVQAK